jgi:hypothetical protein
MEVCRSCKAPVTWVRTEGGNSMPVDAEPVDSGNIVLSHRIVGQPPLALYQSRDMIEQLRRESAAREEPLRLFRSHFASCPNARQHRKR